MKLSFILILALTSNRIYCQNIDLKYLELKGNVKTIREISYKALDSSGTIIKSEQINKINRLIIFNKSGKIAAQYEYGLNGILNQKDTFEYSNSGRLITKRIDSEYEEKFIYDTNGNLVEKKFFYLGNIESKRKYIYDAKRNLKEENYYEYKNEKPSTGSKYSYDNKGNCIEETAYYSGKIDLIYKFAYDKADNKIESYIFDSRKVLTRKEYQSYNADGFVIKFIEIHEPDSILVLTYTYRYVMDQRKNWINKTEFINDIPNIYIERKIEYYPVK